MEVIQAIALLCAVHVGSAGPSSWSATEAVMKEQVACHKYYADCFLEKLNMLRCMKDRK